MFRKNKYKQTIEKLNNEIIELKKDVCNFQYLNENLTNKFIKNYEELKRLQNNPNQDALRIIVDNKDIVHLYIKGKKTSVNEIDFHADTGSLPQLKIDKIIYSNMEWVEEDV